MISARTIAHALAAIAIGATGALVVTTPASAAFPLCADYQRPTATDGSGLSVDVPSTYAGDTSCNLRYGDYNNYAVEVLQKTLIHCYGKSLVVDQDFGTATQNALKSVQSSRGITADGIYGPYTRDKIKHWSGYMNECGYFNGPGGY